ncbi:MAG TPA: ATP-binding cassette domain-containing protein [Candidatus Dormibacteraeota bacterium]|jgi:ABC-type sugar transport system ATPase subunit|nr:ATP-binding cassette domain-containing protein [Candidatus Dormibacteraeota bacterium]
MAEVAEVARTPLISVRGLVKSFGPVRAVDGVSLDLYPGEVLGVVGDNGAGKSTFLSLLAGFHRPDAGRLLHRGREVSLGSPRVARRRLRIEMVYQDLRLAPDLTVWENLFLGEEPRVLGLFSHRRQMRARAERVLRELNTGIRPDDVLSELSGGEQQSVAIARALLFDRDVVIMDEPTAAISVGKVEEVLRLIRELREHGKTVLLVSHRLEDVLGVADRIVVFYHGRIRRVLENRGLQVADLVHEMF